jgi:hypothetical protein
VQLVGIEPTTFSVPMEFPRSYLADGKGFAKTAEIDYQFADADAVVAIVAIAVPVF